MFIEEPKGENLDPKKLNSSLLTLRANFGLAVTDTRDAIVDVLAMESGGVYVR